VSELTLEAMGYRPVEASVARRIFDLTQPTSRRRESLRQILVVRDEPAPQAIALPARQETAA
jgi:hypothetical protein